MQAIRADVLDLLAKGQLKALVHDTLPLEEAAKAHELVENRAVLGKIILRP